MECSLPIGILSKASTADTPFDFLALLYHG